jgi:hypothetical protein
MEQTKQRVSFQQRWSEARPTKTVLFWSWVAAVLATLIIGFTWGGWVTGGTARSMAQGMGDDAVLKRLAPICLAQFKHDPKKEQKLKEFKAVNSWEQGDYVKKQGWATMPGEQEPDGKVADACAKLL